MDVDKLNGAVEEMTQATADSYRPSTRSKLTRCVVWKL